MKLVCQSDTSKLPLVVSLLPTTAAPRQSFLVLPRPCAADILNLPNTNYAAEKGLVYGLEWEFIPSYPGNTATTVQVR